jgi:hypothetical protein
VIRSRFLDEVADEDPIAKRDRLRLLMLTGIYVGEAHRLMGEYEESASSYHEVLRLLDQLGQEKEDDDWNIPYIDAELADLYVRASDDKGARGACAMGGRSAVGDDGEALEEELGEGDIDHEVLGWLWRSAGDMQMLERLGELWTAQRRTEACEGVRAIRETPGGGLDPATRSRGVADLDALAATRDESRRTWPAG